MKTPDRTDAFEGDRAEAEAQEALEKLRRERTSTSAQEFVSNRDALEDAWAQSDQGSDRDAGW